MTINRRQLLQLTSVGLAAGGIQACASDEATISIDTSLPNTPFGADSTAEEVTEGVDLSGQVALVTGCNSGLGY